LRYRSLIYSHIVLIRYMEHSQIDVIYPACPFVYDYRRINETFDAASQELDRDGFLLEVASVGVDYCGTDNSDTDNTLSGGEDESENQEMYRLREMLSYLSEITLDQLNADETQAEYSEIRYYRVDQIIDSADPKYRLDRDGRLTKQLWINLHTIAYDCKTGTTSIDSDMKDVVSWCIVPIIGNVRPMSSDTLIYSDLIDQEITMREEEERFRRENPHLAEARDAVNKKEQAIVDCAIGQDMVNVRMHRFARRNFVKREIEKKDDENKSDKVSNSSAAGSSRFGRNQIVSPNKNQMTFTPKTRQSAQHMRSAIMSKYKVHRLRQVPQQKASHRSIDLRIRNASEKLSDAHNYDVMSRVRFLDRSFSDYRLDDVIISKVNNIWKFTPMTSGRIVLDLSVPEFEIAKGRSAYVRDKPKKEKRVQNLQEARLNPPEMQREGDLIGDAKPKPKVNTKISRIAKRDKVPRQAIEEKVEYKRQKPKWLARKVVTKEEEEAAKEVVGDRVGNDIEPKRTKRQRVKATPKDKIGTGNRRRIRDRVGLADSKARAEALDRLPDMAFVTVVRLDTVLCLTLNCVKVANLAE
jgi:hypothetical protein